MEGAGGYNMEEWRGRVVIGEQLEHRLIATHKNFVETKSQLKKAYTHTHNGYTCTKCTQSN